MTTPIYPLSSLRSIYRQLLCLYRAPNMQHIIDKQQFKQLIYNIYYQKQTQQDDDIYQQVKHIYNKLDYYKMLVPKLYHRKLHLINSIDTTPNISHDFDEQLHTIQNRSNNYTGTTNYYIDENGNLQQGYSPLRNSSIRTHRAQYDITNNEIRRHQALTDRMQFKGPYWEGRT